MGDIPSKGQKILRGIRGRSKRWVLNELERCPIHNNIYVCYCYSCNEFLCRRCSGHSGDCQRINIEVLIKRFIPLKISSFYVRYLTFVLERGKARIQEREFEIEGELAKLRKKQEKYENILNDPAKMKEELTRISEIVKQLKASLRTLKTDKSKIMYEETIMTLKKYTCDAEMSYCKDLLDEVLSEIGSRVEEKELLSNKLKIIEGLSLYISKSKLINPDKAALLRCIKDPFMEVKLADAPKDFEAFWGVQTIPWVRDASQRDLEFKLAENISISSPIYFNFDGRNIDFIITAISSEGLFAYFSSKCKSINSVNLITNQQAKLVGIVSFIQPCFYKDKIYMLFPYQTYMKSARTQMFQTNSDINIKGGIIGIENTLDNSKTPVTGIVGFVGNDMKLSEVDLSTGRAVDLKLNCVNSVISTTGINIKGVKWICCMKDFCTICLVMDDGSHYWMSGSTNTPTVFLPSEKDPANIQDGVFFDIDGNIMTMGHAIKDQQWVVSFKESSSITRLWNDVFLMYDKKKEQWCCLRIHVE